MSLPTPTPRSPGLAAGPQTAWRPATEFHEYRLLRQIGRGGSGLVYAAHDQLLDRLVAIKFILAVDPEAVARFLVEARAAARIQHPNVASIYRIGDFEGRPYLVSEFVHGQSLDMLPKPVKPERALELALGVTRGLAAAHRLGILHRDLKPANAIVSEAGEVKLVDFGLAKLVDTAEPPRPATPTDQSVVPLSLPRLTHAGALVGTPYYMAPELWRGELATHRSDLYSLGVLIYELCAGDVPHGDVPPPELPTAAQSRDPAPLVERAPGLDPALAAVIDRCVRRNPEERFARAEEMLTALEQLLPSSRTAVLPEGNPYRGLEAFGAEHRSLFFGRQTEIRVVLERLRGGAFVLVAGDSGVGKSSLLAAGVVPRITEGALVDGRAWASVRLMPGRRPLATLTSALASALAMPEEQVRRAVNGGPVEVARAVRRRLRHASGLLLFLDQLEELVTMSPLADAAPAAEIIGELCTGVPGVRVLATARSDFLTRLAALPGIGPEIERALYLLRPLSAEGMREAIVGPARAKGVHFEREELVDALVASAARAQGGLPLLQFTLAELWEARDADASTITAAALDAIGGVEGALARHADGVLDRMLPAQRKAARSVLLRLVTIDGTRARRNEEELVTKNRGAARAALEALVRGRLVVACQGEGGGTFEVAHEALLAGWARLRKWLEEDAEARAARHRVETAAAEWERLGRKSEALFGARQLAELAILEIGELPVREDAFLEASRHAVGRARMVRRIVAIAVPLAALLLWAGNRWSARREVDAKIRVHLAEAASLVEANRAREGEHRARMNEALAQFDAHEIRRAETIWTDVLTLGADLDHSYDRAAQTLQRALLLDPAHKKVRAAMGDLLLRRALLAERLRAPLDRSQVSASLALYDESGELRRAWNAPATLAISTQPPGAHVQCWRYDRDASGRYKSVDAGELGTTPLSPRPLDQGSYVLVISAPGHAVVRYPLLASRAEKIELALDLPDESRIPKNFVYVPPGRFLFGSSGDESTRRDFYETTPLHEVRTEGYLIARHETTFAEWIEFLRDLPAAERARHTPKAGNIASHGAMELAEVRGGAWRLTLKPTVKAYVAQEGESIVYESRDRRARQDWLRMPVVAISAHDAEAYVAWLHRAGRVPGARLCTEYEWERAARGADGREFPHGDRIEPDDANYDATYGKHPMAFGPDEVGSYPLSRSPFGLEDMVGNVWEWTRSSLTAENRVLRGGSFYFRASTQHSANRQVPDPTFRDLNAGLRVCASVPPR